MRRRHDDLAYGCTRRSISKDFRHVNIVTNDVRRSDAHVDVGNATTITETERPTYRKSFALHRRTSMTLSDLQGHSNYCKMFCAPRKLWHELARVHLRDLFDLACRFHGAWDTDHLSPVLSVLPQLHLLTNIKSRVKNGSCYGHSLALITVMHFRDCSVAGTFDRCQQASHLLV